MTQVSSPGSMAEYPAAGGLNGENDSRYQLSIDQLPRFGAAELSQLDALGGMMEQPSSAGGPAMHSSASTSTGVSGSGETNAGNDVPRKSFMGRRGSGAGLPTPGEVDEVELMDPEAMSKKDPLATQIWRMYARQKNELANSARMEVSQRNSEVLEAFSD